jgi:hypothetical protein
MLKMSRTLLLAAFILLLVSCAYQPPIVAYDPDGFFMGIIHGLIAPFTLIAGIFSDVRIYAVPTSGWLYDLGFMLGISCWAGAAAN